MDTKTSYEWYLNRQNKMIIKSPHGWNRDPKIDNWIHYYYCKQITYDEYKYRFDMCTLYNNGYDFMSLSYDNALLFWNIKV